ARHDRHPTVQHAHGELLCPAGSDPLPRDRKPRAPRTSSDGLFATLAAPAGCGVESAEIAHRRTDVEEDRMRRVARSTVHVLLFLAVAVGLSGCVLFERSASCAARKMIAPELLKIVSEEDTPNFCVYHRTLAALYAPYAIASLNAYIPPGAPAGAPLPMSCRDEALKVRCPKGWAPDEAQAGQNLVKDVNGLFMEAFVHETDKLALPKTMEYVIAFRGTEPSDLQDWRANFRWL